MNATLRVAIAVSLLAISSLWAESSSPVRLYDLTCEHFENPIGLGKSPEIIGSDLSSVADRILQTSSLPEHG